MTNENAMNNMKDTTAVAPAPNGHGSSNGTLLAETRQANTVNTGTAKGGAPSSKKKKKLHQHHRTPASEPVESAAAATADQHTAAGSTGPSESTAPQPSIDEPAVTPIEEPDAAPIEQPVETLRIRMKVWTDHTTGKRYLMPTAFMRDLVNGRPVTDVMYAYAMRDDGTQLVTLTAGEWNALPFFYFQENGPAPRATTRPVDVVYSHERT